MKHPRVMELRDTKITIEIEARRIPDEAIESNVRQLEESGEEGVVFPYTMVTSLKIGDRQIGLVQGLLLMVQNGVVAPRMAIDLGGHPEMSPALKDSLDMTAAQLKQFPFINWAIHGAVPPLQSMVAPEDEAKCASGPVAVCARSVEELLTQLEQDVAGKKDWHDRIVDEAGHGGPPKR